MRLTLPYPVSANRYWRSFVPRGGRRAIVVPSPEAKRYKRDVANLASAAGMRPIAQGPVEFRCRLVPANAICLDLDNALKVVLDALRGIAYRDDSQVRLIHAERADADPAGGRRLEIEILPARLAMRIEQEAS